MFCVSSSRVGLLSIIFEFPSHIYLLFDEARKKEHDISNENCGLFTEKRLKMECLKSEHVNTEADFQFVTYNASNIFPR